MLNVQPATPTLSLRPVTIPFSPENTHFNFSQGVAPYLISPLEGIQKMGVSVESAMGCNVACQDNSGFATAINVAKSADVVIVVVGLDEGQEG